MNKLKLEKDAVALIIDRLDRKYFSGVDVAEGYLVVSDKLAYFTDDRYYSAAEPLLKEVGVQAFRLKGLGSVKEYLDGLSIKKLCLDFAKTTVKEYEEYKTFGFEILDCSHQIEKSRSIKSKNEILNIEKACAIAQQAYHTAIKNIKVGITEIELKDQLEGLMFSFGAQDVSFETIVAFGANGAVPHHQTGNTKLQLNMPVLVDMGCKVGGYCSDITRTAYFGEPDKKFIDCYQAVLKANQTAIDKIDDKCYTDDADNIARNVLKEFGLDEYFTHSLGHGVGLEIHEYPTLSPRKHQQIENGMVFTIEPGVYFDGEFGIRIEDTVVLDGGKVKRLFSDDKKLIIL